MSRKTMDFISKEAQKLHWFQKGRIITIFNKYFRVFLNKERALAGNKLYTFSSNARRVFLKELLDEPLTKADIRWKKEYGIK